MKINNDNENLKRFYYDLYIFDNDMIVKTITDILLCKNYCYEDYGHDYDYDSHWY